MRLIHQTGNQAKYVLTATELRALDAKCPGFQRAAVDDHVSEIVAYQERSLAERGHVSFAGCIVLCRYADERALLCVDGQHRIQAIGRLLANGALDFEVVVEIHTCRAASEVHDLFRVVNSNRPIPRFLLDDTETPALAIRDHVRDTYPAFVSASARPNVPNVNVDAFAQAVVDKFRGQLPRREEAGAWVDARNAEHKLSLATLKTKHEKVASGVAAIEREYKSTSKSKGARFYLGCYWLDVPRNTALSKPLRALVWRAWYATVEHDASGDALCPCCESARISALDFHLGHKRSFARGGTDEPANLVPLCATCNLSMGARDFAEYRASVHGRGALIASPE
jgi:hypothetical protein